MDLAGAKEFVLRYLSERLNPAFHYHDLAHTLDVHESTVRIATLEKVSGEDLILLETAALFHDIGMTEQYDEHETASDGIARSILPGFGYSPDAIETICRLILATKLPACPLSLLEMIICDADLDYLGRNDFFMRSFQLQIEWELLGILSTNPVEWLEYESEFMKAHDFYTKSAKATRGAGKVKNLEYITTFLQSSTKSKTGK
jgi:uncharacterized protein